MGQILCYDEDSSKRAKLYSWEVILPWIENEDLHVFVSAQGQIPYTPNISSFKSFLNQTLTKKGICNGCSAKLCDN